MARMFLLGARWPIAAVALAALVAAVLLRLAGWSVGDVHAIDRALILALRDPGDLTRPIGSGWLREAATTITALGSGFVLMLVVAGVAGGLALSGARRHAAILVLASVGGDLTVDLLKLLFDRARPTVVPPLVLVRSASFPSAHAANSAIVYLGIAALASPVATRALRRYLVGCALALTLLVGATRVFLGVHWPSDVIAGWAFGGAWALGWWRVARLFGRREERE